MRVQKYGRAFNTALLFSKSIRLRQVVDIADLYDDLESSLFLSAYDKIRNAFHTHLDDNFQHSHVSTVKADLKAEEQRHYDAGTLQQRGHRNRTEAKLPRGVVDIKHSDLPFITEVRPWGGPIFGNTSVNISGPSS